MKKLIAISFLLPLLAAPEAFGTFVKSKTQLGAGGYDETLSGGGDFVEGSRFNKTENWAWLFEFEFSQTPSTDDYGNPDQEHSYNTQPEIEYENGYGFEIDGIFNSSSTPEESLVNSGPEVDFSYDLLLQELKDEDSLPSSLKFKAGSKYQLYVQTFSGTTVPTRAGVTRPTTGFNTLRQISTIGELSFNPSEVLDTDFTFTYYFYDRNVPAFLQYVNSPNSVRLGGGGFASSITNFAQSTIDFDLTLSPFKLWSLYLEVISSISAVDLSTGWSYEGLIYRELGDWKAGLGAQRVTSPSLGNNYYALITITYNF